LLACTSSRWGSRGRTPTTATSSRIMAMPLATRWTSWRPTAWGTTAHCTRKSVLAMTVRATSSDALQTSGATSTHAPASKPKTFSGLAHLGSTRGCLSKSQRPSTRQGECRLTSCSKTSQFTCTTPPLRATCHRPLLARLLVPIQNRAVSPQTPLQRRSQPWRLAW